MISTDFVFLLIFNAIINKKNQIKKHKWKWIVTKALQFVAQHNKSQNALDKH